MSNTAYIIVLFGGLFLWYQISQVHERIDKLKERLEAVERKQAEKDKE